MLTKRLPARSTGICHTAANIANNITTLGELPGLGAFPSLGELTGLGELPTLGELYSLGELATLGELACHTEETC